MKRFASFWGFFQRPLVVTLGAPNVGQWFWAIFTVVIMGNLIFAGFAGNTIAKLYVDLFGGTVRDAYLVLKGISYGSVLMALAFAFGSNQVSVPFATVENHRPTAVLVGAGLFVVGIVLNWPAVLAFINKFDVLWASVTILGVCLFTWAVFGPAIGRFFQSRRNSATHTS